MAITYNRDKLKGSTKTQCDFNVAHNFSLEIDSVITGGIHKIEGIEVEHDVIEYRDGNDPVTHFRPGMKKPGRMKIHKDWSSTSEFFNWYMTVMNGKTERKSISVVIHDDAGGEAMRLNFFECYPSKWSGPSFDAKSSAHANETIDVVFETMEWKGA